MLGRSLGGYTSKLDRLPDGLGNPPRFALTAGQAGDAPNVIPLLGLVAMTAVSADHGHDSDAILAWITEQNAMAFMPSYASSAGTRDTSSYLYKERAKINRVCGEIMRFRCLFRLFDQLACRYVAFAHLVAASMVIG